MANVPRNSEIILDLYRPNLTDGVSSTPLFTPPVDGLYRISAYTDTNDANVPGITNLQISWIDAFGTISRDIEVDRIGIIRALVIHGIPGQPISYSMQALTPLQFYNLHIIVEQL